MRTGTAELRDCGWWMLKHEGVFVGRDRNATKLGCKFDGIEQLVLVLVAMAVGDGPGMKRHNLNQHQILICLQLGCEDALQERSQKIQLNLSSLMA